MPRGISGLNAEAGAVLDVPWAANAEIWDDRRKMRVNQQDANEQSVGKFQRAAEKFPVAVVITAFGTPEICASATAMGAIVVAKPFEFDQLRQLVS